jgi:hypothetical protein
MNHKGCGTRSTQHKLMYALKGTLKQRRLQLVLFFYDCELPEATNWQ